MSTLRTGQKKRTTKAPSYRHPIAADSSRVRPDWSTPCEVCGEVPTVPATGMCGPCTFGEAETAGGGWW